MNCFNQHTTVIFDATNNANIQYWTLDFSFVIPQVTPKKSIKNRQLHRHYRQWLKYVNRKLWNIFRVKLHGSKIKRIRSYHGCSISIISALDCVSSPLLWLSMNPVNILFKGKRVTNRTFRARTIENWADQNWPVIWLTLATS